MPLTEPDHYTLREALDLIAKAYPDEDEAKNLADAASLDIRNGGLRTWVVSNRDGHRWPVGRAWSVARPGPPSRYWKDRADFEFDPGTGLGWLRLRGTLDPGPVEGPVIVDRLGLDAMIAGADDQQAPLTTTPIVESPEPGRGRKPASEQRAAKVNALFEAMHEGDQLTFERGELTRIGKEIGKQVGLQGNSVEREIRPMYRELEQKHRSD